MKLKEVIRQLIEEHSKNGEALVPFSGSLGDGDVLDCSPSHLGVEWKELDESAVRKYLWDSRAEVAEVRTGGGIWSKWIESRGVSVVGLAIVEVAHG